MRSSGIQPPPSRVQSLLVEEAAKLRSFLSLLEQEQHALTGGDVDRLIRLAEEKSALLTCLADLCAARNQALAAESLPPDRPGVEAWFERHPDPQFADAQRAWQDLLVLAVKAREINRVNGQLIGARLAGNQQALSVLLAAANQAALYGPDGQAQPLGSGRSFGAA